MNTTSQEHHTPRTKIAACLFLLTLSVLTSRTCASESEFVAEGVINYQVLSFDGSVLVEQDDFITVSVRDCDWHIKKIPARFLKKGQEQPLAEYGIASSDTTNFYQLASFKRIVSTEPQKREAFAARIGPGGVPFGLSDPKYIILWYAFGSGCYFSTLTSNLVNPPTILKSEEMYAQDFRVRGHWELESRPPFLPKFIAFDAPAALATTTAGTDRGHLTNCVFTVEEFTSQFGLALPKLVTVNFFGWHPMNPTTVIPTSRMRIVVSNFQAHVAVDNFRPDISEPAVISDLRTIASNTPFGVALRDSRNWPKIEDSKRRASARAQALGLVERRNESRATFIRILMISVVIAPALWLGIQRLRVRNKGTKQTKP